VQLKLDVVRSQLIDSDEIVLRYLSQRSANGLLALAKVEVVERD